MKQTSIHHMEHLFKKMMTCALGLRVAVGAVLFVALLFVVSCSSEQEEMPQVEETETEMDIELVALGSVKKAEAQGVTRSWAPPTSFYEYDNLYESDGSIYENYQTLSDKTIDVFFTQGTETTMHGKLNYSSGLDKWKLALKDIEPKDVTDGDYYVYGFIPRSVASSASIALLDSDPETTYADGAILTMNGVPAVISDACVIIGAREGFRTGTEGNYTYYDGGYDDGTETRTNRLTQGDFKFNLKNTTNKDGVAVPSNKYLFLLFDHLCSAISISMKVHNEYDALRTIKVKKIHMNTANDDGITKLMNVTVVLRANNSGTDPIESVTYTPTATESTGGYVFTSAEGLQLGTTQKRFLTHFVPEGVHTMVMTTTYDIYDKKGNLIRKDCMATNTLKFNELMDRFVSAERGVLYSLNLTIQPTYLYVLSEPDLNDPEFTVE